MIIGPPDTLYKGGYFKACLTFQEYPQKPQKRRFLTDMWHTNVYLDGKVCISILHEPGEDEFGYKKPEEKWLPVHSVILVISMWSEPNDQSPAMLMQIENEAKIIRFFKKHIMQYV